MWSSSGVSVLVFMSDWFLNCAEIENADSGPRDHQFLVGANDADDAAGVREISGAFFGIALLVQFDAEETQTFADALPDRRRVLADAAREDQRVQSAQRRRKGADPFLGLVAKQRHRFRRPNICASRSSKSRMSELVSEMPSSPDSWLTISLKLLSRHLLGSRQIRDQARIQIARAGAHHQAGRRSEAHAGVDAFAVAHRRHARAVAEMRENHATLSLPPGRRGARVPPSECIRQAVKAVASYPCAS